MAQKGKEMAVLDVAQIGALAESGDPDRVVAEIDLGGIKAPVTHRAAARGAGRGLQAEIRAQVRSARLAVAVAQGLCTLAEIDEISDKRLGVMIELRRNGSLPRIGDAK